MARLRPLMTDSDRAKSRRSRRRPEPGWYLWPATRPRSTAISMNCGPGLTFGPRARRRGPAAGHQCLARLAQGTVCKLPPVRKSGSTRCATIWNAATRGFQAQDGGSSVSSPRGPGPEKSRCQGPEKSKKPVAIVSYGREAWDQGHRHDGTGHRQCQAAMRASRGIIVQTPWHAQPVGQDPVLTGKVHALVGSATAAKCCINSSSFSMPPIRPAPRSS